MQVMHGTSKPAVLICLRLADRAVAMVYHASQEDLHQELQQRLEKQYPGQIKYLLYCLERLATHPGAWWNSPGVRDKQHRCRLERCLKEYQRVAFGPGKDMELAQSLRNDVIIPALHPRDVLRAQWGHLSGSKSINERLIMEAMLRKPLEEHHASIELELGTQCWLLCTISAGCCMLIACHHRPVASLHLSHDLWISAHLWCSCRSHEA